MAYDDDPETTEFTTAELIELLRGPHLEEWTDVIRALAQRTLAEVPDAASLDAAAIVRNLAATISAARDITAHAIAADELAEAQAEAWSAIRDHLDQAAEGLGWIATGWI